MTRLHQNFRRIASRLTLRLLAAAWLACLASAVPSPAIAQVTVAPQAVAAIDRGFYFAADGTLIHIERVRNVAGRFIEPLPAGLTLPTNLPQRPPPEGGASAVLVGAAASYVVYYGPDAQSVPLPGRTVNAVPVAFERLRAADTNRPIECAVPGSDVCRYPMMCHCGGSGGCCCY